MEEEPNRSQSPPSGRGKENSPAGRPAQPEQPKAAEVAAEQTEKRPKCTEGPERRAVVGPGCSRE